MSTAQRAFSFVAATKKSAKNTLYLHCNVKPGASKNREGIASVGEEAVEICVAAQAREGEANKAVIKVLSEVLDLPKSDLQITHGLKSRNKTVAIVGSWVDKGEEECLRRVHPDTTRKMLTMHLPTLHMSGIASKARRRAMTITPPQIIGDREPSAARAH
ncbi:hypothetical protein VTJ49DRAFT_1340 [Mycothermus thermophilus]|uniref:YggU-like protein n=1 Tax=Humicola insolens TaxID=85995 RepID=A0ABR3VDK1_HUMIN